MSEKNQKPSEDLNERLRKIVQSVKEDALKNIQKERKKIEEEQKIFMTLEEYIEKNRQHLEQAASISKKLNAEAFPELWSEVAKEDDDVLTKVSSLQVRKSARLYAGLLYSSYQKRISERKKNKENIH